MIEITVENHSSIHNIFMISTVPYQPKQSIYLFFRSCLSNQSDTKILLNQPLKCSFTLHNRQLFHLGKAPQTLNTLLISISFNNPIWISTLCIWQSQTDSYQATNIIWNTLPICNTHFSKTLIKSAFLPCGHHSSERHHAMTSAL